MKIKLKLFVILSWNYIVNELNWGEFYIFAVFKSYYWYPYYFITKKHSTVCLSKKNWAYAVYLNMALLRNVLN